jgi:hypothetical protein
LGLGVASEFIHWFMVEQVNLGRAGKQRIQEGWRHWLLHLPDIGTIRAHASRYPESRARWLFWLCYIFSQLSLPVAVVVGLTFG